MSGWTQYAEELAAWAWTHLRNRGDAYGAYSAIEQRGREYTRSDGSVGKVPKNYTAKRTLTIETLQRHFIGRAPEHTIGLHSTSTDDRCLWGAFDIDRHSDEVSPEETFARAGRLYRHCQNEALDPLLLDADGKGGFHIWVLFREPVPSVNLHYYLQRIAQFCGYPGEQFPKQASVKGGYGNWLRVPGRHHTRDHFASVFDGSGWLVGAEACQEILRHKGVEPCLVPRKPPAILKPSHPQKLPNARRDPDGRMGAICRRICAYLAKCPHKGEGEGRDDVAYCLAAMLVRDLQLSDSEAHGYLRAWDSGNSPPKGDARLAQIITSAHAYGRHSYGSGLGVQS